MVTDSPQQTSPAATKAPQISTEEGKGKQQAGIGMETPAREEKCKHHENVVATQQKERNEGALHSHNEMTWQVQAARMEDGWQVVKGKKEKRGAKDPFEMILRSQSRGRGKT